MKLKLDENLARSARDLLAEAGCDVATVFEQGLCSTSDRELVSVCRREKRCLVTLDLDFANPLLFRVSDYFGIAVLRLPLKPSLTDMLDAVRTLIGALQKMDITGQLWVVQRGRVRIYLKEEP